MHSQTRIFYGVYNFLKSEYRISIGINKRKYINKNTGEMFIIYTKNSKYYSNIDFKKNLSKC